MMPPTSIDGTDITGATIDGTEVTEITVDGDNVFTAEKIIDDFESQSLSNYTAYGPVFIDTANPMVGTASLNLNLPGDNFETYGVASNSGLANYPTAGDSIQVLIEIDGDFNAGINFGMAWQGNQIGRLDGYVFRVFEYPAFDKNGNIDILVDGTTTRIEANSDLGTISTMRYEIDWGTNGDLDFEVFDHDTNTSFGAVSTNDSTYTSGGVQFSGGTVYQSNSAPPPPELRMDQAKIV